MLDPVNSRSFDSNFASGITALQSMISSACRTYYSFRSLPSLRQAESGPRRCCVAPKAETQMTSGRIFHHIEQKANTTNDQPFTPPPVPAGRKSRSTLHCLGAVPCLRSIARATKQIPPNAKLSDGPVRRDTRLMSTRGTTHHSGLIRLSRAHHRTTFLSLPTFNSVINCIDR